jgi:hypothetical protein
MTNLTTAIKTARTQVSQLLPRSGQWYVQTYCEIGKGWFESHQTSYAQAQAIRSQSLINKTLINLGMTLEDAQYFSQKYEGGSWLECVRKHAKQIRQEASFKARFQEI